MKINGINSNSLSFQKVYVSEKGLTKPAKDKMELFVLPFEYSSEIKELDKMGVDLLVLPADFEDGEGARVYFADDKRRVYKVNDNFAVESGAFQPIGKVKSSHFDAIKNGVKEVFEKIDEILTGGITEKSMLPNPIVEKTLSDVEDDEFVQNID